MNKHEKAAANRTLLAHWLSLLESAFEKHEQKQDDLLLKSGGCPVSVPEIKLPPVSEDMKALILRGIERALDGDPDPFQLKPPRGKKPKLDRQGRIDLAYYIYRLVEVEKKGERGGSNRPGGREVFSICWVPCDYIPQRSYPLFRARDVLSSLIEEAKASRHKP